MCLRNLNDKQSRQVMAAVPGYGITNVTSGEEYVVRLIGRATREGSE